MRSRLREIPRTWRKLFLTMAGVVTLAVSLVVGVLTAPVQAQSPRDQAQEPSTAVADKLAFEVASIKPNRSGDQRVSIGTPLGRFVATNVTARMLIEFAFNGNQSGFSLRDDQISGGPSWINSERYDIDAKVEDSLSQQEQKLSPDQRGRLIRLMLQLLLADRFKLKVTHSTKELPVYALVLAKNGAKLTPSTVLPLSPPSANPSGSEPPKGPIMRMGRGQIAGTGMSVGALADILSRQPEIGGRMVVDQTGLTASYDFTLQWTPEIPTPAANGAGNGTQGTANAPPFDSSGPSLFTAIQEQLGLRLESQKGPIDVLVIDHIEQPSEN